MKEKKNGFFILLSIIILILLVVVVFLVNTSLKLKKESENLQKANVSLSNSLENLEKEVNQIKAVKQQKTDSASTTPTSIDSASIDSIDDLVGEMNEMKAELWELDWKVGDHIQNNPHYDYETKMYYYVVCYEDCGSELVASETSDTPFEFLYSNSGYRGNKGYNKANYVKYNGHVYSLKDALENLVINYQNEPLIIYFSEENPAEELNTVKWTSITFGDYTIHPFLSNGGVLNFVISDRFGDVYAKTVQPQIDKETFLQGNSEDEWSLAYWEAYVSDYEVFSSDYEKISIIDKLKSLTGKELSKEDALIANLLFELIQDRNCYVPGFLSADNYQKDGFRFDLVDLDKNGIKEILVDKGRLAIYVPKSTWEDSLAISDVVGLNAEEGILEVKQGDQLEKNTYYRFSNGELEVLTSMSRDITTGTYVLDDPEKGQTEIAEEEYEKTLYGVSDYYANSAINLKTLNPSEILKFFYN